MGLSTTTARWLAIASFAIDLTAQSYGMLSKPNMLDIHEAHRSFFTPQPWCIALFFFSQQVLQLAWLRRLWTSTASSEAEDQLRDGALQIDYVPFYAVGNVCLALWMIFWNQAALKIANLFVAINAVTQLSYLLLRLEPLRRGSRSLLLTHLVVKTFAGLAVLDLLHNSSIAYFENQSPGLAVRVVTGVGFIVATASSDWILGGALVYDLFALAVGQAGIEGAMGWARLLGGYAAASAVLGSLKNWWRPPYEPQRGYERVAEGQSNED